VLLQLEIKDEQSEFFLNLLNQLKSTIKNITILEPKQKLSTEEDMQSNTYFEITDSNGIHHKIPNWEDGEFEGFGLKSLYKEKSDISTQELFNV